ncbi:MAG: bifunctional adenosylcobinamide kinase/adenosylcobinamide-phosphate guanylyltransferase [Intrasporangium sp.]|uniref:bifunctional adenosylcobinamide kinase/adenosylcobinamide-phosphate guanylyltransferase n=1 Tax=Intrasporangium sp. TaxID=1925024 RepID=UPI002648014A|nr:bifunctional adenosylcobinamide kinase/adenosylcobinamide-phosphate guanylyltransferase [Intrasporangium sp.]MDN5796606.1 bifunctional adenosylcobinamide kinase/adenosylcobinamide-phosphate guanylyltransferase [Intrasporangium sp.]
MTVTLVTGPVRSGKSRHAEDLLSAHREVTYLATGPRPAGDPAWAARVEQHRRRRPAGWTTIESLDVAAAVRRARLPLLVDCLGTWLTGLVDKTGWGDLLAAAAAVGAAREDLTAALAEAMVPVVLVTNEVGWGVVPPTDSGRFFQDELGRVNAAVSAQSVAVHLVVAGRVLDLSGAPLVPERPAPRRLRA